MVGHQHQDAADQVRARAARPLAPGQRQTIVDRAAADLARDGVGQHVQQGRGLDRQGQGRATPRGGIGRRPLRQGQIAPRAHVGAGRGLRPVGALERRAMAAPQQSGHRFQGLGLGQADGVAAAVEQPPAADGGDLGAEHRLAPADGALGHLRDLAAARLALGQRRDVGGPIEAAARVGGIGPHAHPAAAHIGVERLRPHLQAGLRFLGGDPVGGRHYILIMLIKIDDVSLKAFLSVRKRDGEPHDRCFRWTGRRRRR